MAHPESWTIQDAHTVTVVAAGLAITKQVSVVGGGAALPGGQLDYLVHVTNASTTAATPVVITDNLSTAGAGRLTFVNPSSDDERLRERCHYCGLAADRKLLCCQRAVAARTIH